MPSVPLNPLRFDPIFKPAIWGGRRLAELFRGAPEDGPIGEAWVLSDQGVNVSAVADGSLKGMTLRNLMRDRRDELLGPTLAHHDTFPLLLKFIDACDHLSVQVHPDDELAQTLACVPRGKTEAWVVIHAEPGCRIYAGLKDAVDREQLERAVGDGSVVDCLHSYEPAIGDCVFLPAGTVHALGAGITIFEVQQTSDTTYRLFDWNRVDAKTGKRRDLHIEKALASTNFAHGPVRPVAPRLESGIGETTCLVDCAYFTISRTTLLAAESKRLVRHATAKNAKGILPSVFGCRILVPLSGRLSLRALPDFEREFELAENEIALCPAGMDILCAPPGPVTFLDIRPK